MVFGNSKGGAKGNAGAIFNLPALSDGSKCAFTVQAGGANKNCLSTGMTAFAIQCSRLSCSRNSRWDSLAVGSSFGPWHSGCCCLRQMGYTKDIWKRRLAERTDLTTQLTHLTKAEDDQNLTGVLMSILSERRIRGSDSTFIYGDKRAVCFQDAPLSGICQNVYFEQRYRKENPEAKRRYCACGLMFGKAYVFSRGGRPVIYDRAEDAKEYLQEDEWWRIVPLDFSNTEKIVDWTHEREWRVPKAFNFEIEKATVILPNTKIYREFTEQCAEELPDVLSQLRGIVVMSNILY